ncbi:hypothetical protein BST81_16110 [Leptolyngbya sp. 'hensonii']|uniref:hypothetical protein n=1 Tax=Leptolyngbya sp. 'hensonii' TaxID=1922337 RepID=UPI00094FCB6A|nr:hypothetical protein [Leptolyngbya sp. 'hensonii']OLP17328.1 hypothetical protein BST81_16110 [Leptolyngbya sp. 'hensonii']
MRRQKRLRKVGASYLLAGGTVLAAAGLLINPQEFFNNDRVVKDVCQEIIQPKATLSREELLRLLSIPERSNKTRVRQIVRDPYCNLPSIEVREGITADREAYPLSFDNQIRVVLLYEGNEYAGYSFAFQP